MLLKVTSALSLAGVLSWWNSSICGSMKRRLGQRARPELGKKKKQKTKSQRKRSSPVKQQQKACSVCSGFYTSLHRGDWMVLGWPKWWKDQSNLTAGCRSYFFLLAWRNFEVFKPLTCLFCKTVASDQLHIHSVAYCWSISFSKSFYRGFNIQFAVKSSATCCSMSLHFLGCFYSR